MGISVSCRCTVSSSNQYICSLGIDGIISVSLSKLRLVPCCIHGVSSVTWKHAECCSARAAVLVQCDTTRQDNESILEGLGCHWSSKYNYSSWQNHRHSCVAMLSQCVFVFVYRRACLMSSQMWCCVSLRCGTNALIPANMYSCIAPLIMLSQASSMIIMMTIASPLLLVLVPVMCVMNYKLAQLYRHSSREIKRMDSITNSFVHRSVLYEVARQIYVYWLWWLSYIAQMACVCVQPLLWDRWRFDNHSRIQNTAART